MINLISTQAHAAGVSGPRKVFVNLCKGLDKIGHPYVVNHDLNAAGRLWIHDDIVALRYMHRSRSSVVVGPNLFVLPHEMPPRLRLSDVVYLHPCEWAVKLWLATGFDTCPIVAWPVGIDTEDFRPSRVPAAERVVTIYHKRRDPAELEVIKNTLSSLGLNWVLVKYGEYCEEQFKEVLSRTSFVVWHGRHESQGIALQETMACDVPVLVCDVTRLSQAVDVYQFPPGLDSVRVTSAPYFDDRCGVKIRDLRMLSAAVERIVGGLAGNAPRQFVLEHLSLEGQARSFVELWERRSVSSNEVEMTAARHPKVLTEWHPPLEERLRQARAKLRMKLQRVMSRVG